MQEELHESSIHGEWETGPVKFTQMLKRTGSTMLKTASEEGRLRAVPCIALTLATVDHPANDW